MADFDLNNYTPVDNTGGMRNIFKSGYKNMKFSVQKTAQLKITAQMMSNLPGIAFTYYRDTSLWRGLMAYNGLSDALSDICVGLVLNIPDKASLIAYLSAQQAKSNNLNLSI